MTDIFEKEQKERTEKLQEIKNKLVKHSNFKSNRVDIETEVSYGEEKPHHVRVEIAREGLKINYSVEDNGFSYLWYDNGDLVEQDSVDTISELVDKANELYKKH